MKGLWKPIGFPWIYKFRSPEYHCHDPRKRFQVVVIADRWWWNFCCLESLFTVGVTCLTTTTGCFNRLWCELKELFFLGGDSQKDPATKEMLVLVLAREYMEIFKMSASYMVVLNELRNVILIRVVKCCLLDFVLLSWNQWFEATQI